MAASSRRLQNDTFRPALRFPTDPHRPDILPSKIQQIVGPSPSQQQVVAQSLLQSRRQPWELDLTRLEEMSRLGEKARKVVLVLGDVPQTTLQPVISSSLLRNSLVIIVTASESNLGLNAQRCAPSVRILRLKPRRQSAAPIPILKSKGKSAPASTTPATSSNPEQPLTAFRLTAIMEWAERVANAWRSSAAGTQPRFAILDEGDTPADGISSPASGGGLSVPKLKSKGSKSKIENHRSLSSKSTTSLRSEDGVDNSKLGSPEDAPPEGLMRRRRLAAASESSTTLESIPDVDDLDRLEEAGRRALSSIGHGSGAGASPYGGSTPTQRRQDSMQRSSTVKQKRGSILSVLNNKPTPISSPDPPTTAVPAKPLKPAFDTILNFLPPPSSTSPTPLHANQGQIASQHAQALHAKSILRETILITTVTRQYLAPLPLNKPHAGRWSEEEMEKGMFTRGDAYSGSGVRMRAVTVDGKSVAVAAASRSLVDFRKPSTGRKDRRPASAQIGVGGGGSRVGKRLSVTLGLFFSGKGEMPAAKDQAQAPPTPPRSRGSSEEEELDAEPTIAAPGAFRRASASASSLSNPENAPPVKPASQLIHVLPFSSSQAQLNAGTAKLIRNLEAFLLSWSFGGTRQNSGGDEGDESDADHEEYGKLHEKGTGTSSGRSVKGRVRPYLLDLSGLSDILQVPATTPNSEDSTSPNGGRATSWPLLDIILSGSVDDEYFCTRLNPSPSISRTNSAILGDRLTVPGPSSPPMSMSRASSASSGLSSWSTVVGGFGNANDDVSWATRRAWLGGVDDLAVYRVPSGGSGSRPASYASGSGRTPSTSSVSELMVIKRARHQSLWSPPPVEYSGPASSSSSSTLGPLPAAYGQIPGQVQASPPSSWTGSPPMPKPPSPPALPAGAAPPDRGRSPTIRVVESEVIMTSSPEQIPVPMPPSPPEPVASPEAQPMPRSMSADSRPSAPLPSRPQIVTPLPSSPSSLRNVITPPRDLDTVSRAPVSAQRPGQGHARRPSDGRTIPSSPALSSIPAPSPLRNAVVSAQPQRPKSPPDKDKKLPPPPSSLRMTTLPTPPDSASSSSVSNDATGSEEAAKDKKKKTKWWSGGGAKLLKIL